MENIQYAIEYCSVHNSTDDATFAAQKKIKGLCILFIFILSMGTAYIFSSSPSCTESHDNKFTGEKSFFAEQIASETIFFCLSSNCIFNLLIFRWLNG
jgi:hypothetical protein